MTDDNLKLGAQGKGKHQGKGKRQGKGKGKGKRKTINYYLSHTYTSLKCSQTPPSGFSGHFRTTTDTNRHQTTPTDVARHPKRVFKDVWLFMLTSNVVCRRLLVSNDVLYCLMLSADVKRMSKKFLKGYLSAEWI